MIHDFDLEILSSDTTPKSLNPKYLQKQPVLFASSPQKQPVVLLTSGKIYQYLFNGSVISLVINGAGKQVTRCSARQSQIDSREE